MIKVVQAAVNQKQVKLGLTVQAGLLCGAADSAPASVFPPLLRPSCALTRDLWT